MIIKRYIVDNMNEALVKIRYELGSEAVIVSQRKIAQRGILGFLKKKKIEVTAAADEKSNRSKAVPRPKEEQNEDIHKEIGELKILVQGLMDNKEQKSPGKKDNKTKYRQKLVENDIPERDADELIAEIKERNKDKKLNAALYDKEVKNLLMEMVQTDKSKSGRIHALIGPTGVGKTTTLAKLASVYTLHKSKKVGLITIDTYRIGAVEQLKTYAEILGIPFGVVLTSKDIPEVLSKMEDCDIIFVDTTGRNSKNTLQVAETRKFIQELKADRVYLVVSMTTKQRDMEKIIENYKQVNFNGLIITKVDETEAAGSILTAIKHGKVPISYLTTGQNVPEDIEEASKERIVNLIVGAV
jgi:flagellar biosynthesis protein FlhF